MQGTAQITPDSRRIKVPSKSKNAIDAEGVLTRDVYPIDARAGPDLLRAMKLSFAIPLVMLACVSGCGGETGGPTSDAGPKPNAAINMEIYATAEQDCPIGNVHVDVGNTKSVPPATVTDGQGGATVSCTVASAGAQGIGARASIAAGNLVFSFDSVVTDGSSTTGHVTVQDPATGIDYGSTAQKPCVFQFAPGTDQGIQLGHVFMQFDCAELQKAEDPAKSCSSRYGYVYADNCEQ